MKHRICGLAVAACAGLFAGGASAAPTSVVLDFIGEAAGNERGATEFNFVFDGLAVTVTASHQAYLDDLSGGLPAGLGVCSSGLVTKKGKADQCAEGGDDNVTEGEWVKLDFGDVFIDGGMFSFRGANHAELPNPYAQNRTYLVGYNIDGNDIDTLGMSQLFGADLPERTFTSIVFGYGGDNAGQFYVSGGTADVPLPGVLSLLGIGAVAMGFGASRRRRDSALEPVASNA